MTTEDRESLQDEWRLRFEEFSRSEMTVVDWCSSNLIPIHQFYYWRKKFAPDAPRKSDSSDWLAVDVVEPPAGAGSPSGVSVRLGSAVIDVAPGFNPSVLCAVVAALEPRRC